MPKQINSEYNEVNIPFSKMTFSPDVPASSLGPNEYNIGKNIETDVRGIRSVAGDIEILSSITGTPTYISSGFRRSGEFWFIVATVEGYWYATNGTTVDWYDITPGGTAIPGYAQNTNITEAWNGTVPFFNDGIGAPMFLPDEDNATLVPYSNTIKPKVISNITYVSPTEQQITVSDAYSTAPFSAGEKIVISGTATDYVGTFTVVSSTTTTINYTSVPGAGAYPGGATVSPQYTWNYNTDWKSYSAGFLRLYSTPNVGSILVAGNLTAVNNDDETEIYPVTVQWSQAFGLNQAPLTWEPTITNVANQLEVPLRGPAVDAFQSNGQFFLCSYWDTVVFSPINYSTTSAPILGVRLYNQGRGLLSSNCWANTDKLVYGIDARDIWVFDGQDFQGLGNQRVKNWFFDQLDPQYYDRVFMEVNSQKNQVEIYYPDADATNGVPNKMISYRYDLDVWNPPRDVVSATFACESPIWYETTPGDYENALSSRTIVFAKGVANSKLVEKDYGYEINNSAIESYFRRDNIKLLKDYSGKLMVHRILPEVVNMGGVPFSTSRDYNTQVANSYGTISVTVEGANSVGQNPQQTTEITMDINTDNPWIQPNQNSHRVNSIEISNTSNNSIWMCTSSTWQYTQVEDDR